LVIAASFIPAREQELDHPRPEGSKNPQTSFRGISKKSKVSYARSGMDKASVWVELFGMVSPLWTLQVYVPAHDE